MVTRWLFICGLYLAPLSATEGAPHLSLEAKIEGPQRLYPGQQTDLVYRIAYNYHTDLTHSHFPLLSPLPLQRIGEVQIAEWEEGEMAIQEITQRVQARGEEGTISLGPSTIEGYAYRLTEKGEKEVIPSLLSATAPSIEIEIIPFPSAHRPPSFNGALGYMTAELSLLSSPVIEVGTPFRLKLCIQGLSHPEQFHLPPFGYQPGFPGFFALQSPALRVKEEKDNVTFWIEARPLLSLVWEIPSIELSSFDVTTGEYVICHTNPIPLKEREKGDGVREVKEERADDGALPQTPPKG